MHFTPPPVQATSDTGPNIRLSQHRKQPLSATEPGRVCCLPTAKLHLTCLHRGTNSTLATKPGTSNLRSMSSKWETRARYLHYRKLLIIPPSSSMSTEPPGEPLKTSCTFPTRLALPHSPSHPSSSPPACTYGIFSIRTTFPSKSHGNSPPMAPSRPADPEEHNTAIGDGTSRDGWDRIL